MQSNKRDELDNIIDGALPGYSGAEPLAGLDHRVLNRICVAQAARSSRRPWRWALALSVVASMVFAAILLQTRQRSVPKGPEIVRALPPTSPQTPQPVPTLKRNAPAMHGRRPKAMPKLEVFPAPAPLTSEERALMAFVKHDREQAEQTFAELRRRNDEPIDIQPIQIRLLQDHGAR